MEGHLLAQPVYHGEVHDFLLSLWNTLTDWSGNLARAIQPVMNSTAFDFVSMYMREKALDAT